MFCQDLSFDKIYRSLPVISNNEPETVTVKVLQEFSLLFAIIPAIHATITLVKYYLTGKGFYL
uniref:Uncharacterized protein n=1 Tax=Rhizophagus irregularis (strain DAOM 181602 / DAOM 197198 / MUCL 43194) TaxID=747089 RepID=U9TT31_RHIID